VATAARDDCQRSHIARQADLIVAEAGQDDAPEQVRAMARRVRQALGGDVRAAYRDRSGETRSL
jgi:hypothetical protein